MSDGVCTINCTSEAIAHRRFEVKRVYLSQPKFSQTAAGLKVVRVLRELKRGLRDLRIEATAAGCEQDSSESDMLPLLTGNI